MKCFIAIDEDLLLKLWMLDPQLVAPFSHAEIACNNSECDAKKRSEYQLTECDLSIEGEASIQFSQGRNIARLP